MLYKSNLHFYILAFIFISFSFTHYLCAQSKINNNWYFGYNAGITFNTTPPSALLNGALSSLEGCASISDDAGNTLFYSNGENIWDANNQIMPNGSNLLGFGSASQGVVIVPKPSDKNRYYLFYTSAQEQTAKHLYYSEVDITLNGGLGDIIPSHKNIILIDSVSEKITATLHGNGLYYWVITSRLDSKEYYSYLVDCNGINAAPIISTTSASIITSVGEIIISPDGNKFATNRIADRIIEYGDFDKFTGVLSNSININLAYLNPNTNLPAFPSSISFSANNRFIYASSFLGGEIFQFDATAPNISASQLFIGQSNHSSPVVGINCKMQLGPDDKIYISQYQDVFLGKIDNPNILGTGCNYIENAINLDGNTNAFSLPQLVKKRQALIDFTATNFCVKSPTEFTFSANSPYDSVLWNFGDPIAGNLNFSSVNSPQHIYNKPGSYSVKLIGYLACVSDTIIKTITISQAPNLAYTSLPKCAGDSTVFYMLNDTNDTTYYNANWLIYHNNSPFQSSDSAYNFQFNNAGQYHIQLISNSSLCSDTSFIDFEIHSQPKVEISTSTICSKDAIITASVTLPSGESYSTNWMVYKNAQLIKTSSENPLLISENGIITVDLVVKTAFGCEEKASQQIAFIQNDTNFQIPNVLKLSSNSGNEIIDFNLISPALNSCNNYVFTVFNRWGYKVYEFQNDKNNPDINCNQCFKGFTNAGEPLSSGTYFYILQGENDFIRKGNISIFD